MRVRFGSVRREPSRRRRRASAGAGGSADAGVVEGVALGGEDSEGSAEEESEFVGAGGDDYAERAFAPAGEFPWGEKAEGRVGSGPFREAGRAQDPRGVAPATTDTSDGENLESFDTRTG